MADADRLDSLSEAAARLEATMSGAEAMTAAFDAELRRMQESMTFTAREANALSGAVGRSLLDLMGKLDWQAYDYKAERSRK